MRATTEKHRPSDLRLREVAQWSPDNDPYFYIRWDFAWKDPASGWVYQYGVDAYVDETTLADLERRNFLADTAKATIGATLRRKCGLDRAIANRIFLELPRTAKHARYV